MSPVLPYGGPEYIHLGYHHCLPKNTFPGSWRKEWSWDKKPDTHRNYECPTGTLTAKTQHPRQQLISGNLCLLIISRSVLTLQAENLILGRWVRVSGFPWTSRLEFQTAYQNESVVVLEFFEKKKKNFIITLNLLKNSMDFENSVASHFSKPSFYHAMEHL